MHKYLSEFGLSPVSRSRVTVKADPFKRKPWEWPLEEDDEGFA